MCAAVGGGPMRTSQEFCSNFPLSLATLRKGTHFPVLAENLEAFKCNLIGRLSSSWWFIVGMSLLMVEC